MEYLRTFHGVIHRDKARNCEIRKTLNVKSFLRIEKSQLYVGSAIWPECLRKDWRGKSCWLNPRESAPEVVQGPGGVNTSPTLLGPVLVCSEQNSDCCWSWGVSRSRAVVPASPAGKAGRKMNEWVKLHHPWAKQLHGGGASISPVRRSCLTHVLCMSRACHVSNMGAGPYCGKPFLPVQRLHCMWLWQLHCADFLLSYFPAAGQLCLRSGTSNVTVRCLSTFIFLFRWKRTERLRFPSSGNCVFEIEDVTPLSRCSWCYICRLLPGPC